MALTFPRSDFFTRYSIATTFRLNRRQTFSRNAAGVATVISDRSPFWEAQFESAVMSEDDCVALEADLDSLDGMIREFLAVDTRRPYPRLGPQSAAYATASMSAANPAASTVAFSGLPASLKLSIGDRFSVANGSSHYLFELVEAITANGSGITGNVEVRPRPPSFLTAPRAATFALPKCSMRLDPASIQFNRSGALLGTVAFSASQMT